MPAKHVIAYIDEEDSAIRNFQLAVSSDFEVIPIEPIPNIDDFLEQLLNYQEIEAFVIDHLLNEKPKDPRIIVNYTGTDLISKIWEIKNDFPAIILTGHDRSAIDAIDDVNYVYPKGILTSQNDNVLFTEKLKIQIEHYKSRLNNISNEFDILEEKNRISTLTPEEENRLLELDSILEKMVNKRESLPPERRSAIVLERIDKLIETTKEILIELKEE